MKLILLTHSREVQKQTNTGQLVQKILTECETIIWQRKQPDAGLLNLIESEKTALVYPSGSEVSGTEISDYKNFILIDGTWQEARKIYNHSPYLQQLPEVQFSIKNPSRYNLRRNQLEGGLCTAECAIHLLHELHANEVANRLEFALNEFVNI